MATIKDVARLAGVSVSTVSLVLNTAKDDHRVSPETWMKVHNAMDVLKYKPSTAARKLRRSEKDIPTVGVFWPKNYQTGVLGDALVYIQNAFDRAYFECHMVVFMFQPGHLNECRQLRDEDSVAGAIIGLADTEDMEWIEQEKIRIPLVMFNRQLKPYNFVRSDNRAMGRLAAQLLIKDQCRTAALFHVKELDRGIERRVEDFIREYSGDAQKHYDEYTFDSDLNLENVISQTEAMIRNGIPQAAVYFTGEHAAYTSLYYLMKNQIRVPEDIKILLVNLNFGGWSRYVSPSLTIVTVSSEQMLTDCVQILIRQMKEPDELPIHKIYPPEIYYGETFPESPGCSKRGN